MFARPTAPLPIGGVLDDAIKIYRESFRRVWQLSLMSAVLMAMITIYTLRQLPTTAGASAQAGLAALTSMLHAWPWWLLASVISVVIFGAVIASQNSVAAGREQMSIGEALTTSLAKLHWQILTAIVVALIIALGTLLLIIPGIYFYGQLSLVSVAIFAENATTGGAIEKSWKLVSGNWWRTATIVTVGLILLWVIAMVFGVVSALIAIPLRHDQASMILATQAVGIVQRVFIMPVLPAVLIATYHDLKLRREGGDLAARAKALKAG